MSDLEQPKDMGLKELLVLRDQVVAKSTMHRDAYERAVQCEIWASKTGDPYLSTWLIGVANALRRLHEKPSAGGAEQAREDRLCPFGHSLHQKTDRDGLSLLDIAPSEEAKAVLLKMDQRMKEKDNV